jgi:hypothetical protein
MEELIKLVENDKNENSGTNKPPYNFYYQLKIHKSQ